MNETYADCMYTLSYHVLAIEKIEDETGFWIGIMDQTAGHTSYHRRHQRRDDDQKGIIVTSEL